MEVYNAPRNLGMSIMPRLAPKIVASLACFAVLFGSPAAESKTLVKKRVGFFESLFGASTHRQPTIVNPNGDKINWWEEQQLRRQQSGIDLIYGSPNPKKNRQNAIAEFAEPEPLLGLGMGIVAYQPPIVATVFDASFLNLSAATPEAEAIRLVLSDRNNNIRSVDIERKAIIALYKSNDFKPLWTDTGHISARANAILKIFANSASDGLVPTNYLPAGLESFDNADSAIVGDAQKLAKFDVALTAATLKYARQISGGQFDPNRLSLYNDIKPEPVNADSALRVLAFTPYPEAYLGGLTPKNPQYAIFKDQLSKVKVDSAPIDLVAAGRTVKAGKTDSRIPQIRAKLQTLGVLSADDAVNSNEELLDTAVSTSLKAFQKSNNLKQTGALDAATVKVFNADHRDDERQALIYNMERLRWLPKNLGYRYVLVNQPAFEVNVMQGGKSVWNSRVVVGRPMTQTYAFSDSIETVVFNPTWGVPASIIVNEYGPKSRKDPSYLDRNGFKVINSSGDVVSSEDIDWYGMGQVPNFGVQQPAGDGNALGELKFVFPNVHDIYMHDTPSKNLFAESMRAFSHGCVRVQNPRGFAEALLGWSQTDIAATISTGDSLPVKLKQATPVHLTYFTAWTSEDGKIHYYNDIYGRDAAMAKAFAFGNAPKNLSSTDKIVQTGSISGEMIQN